MNEYINACVENINIINGRVSNNNYKNPIDKFEDIIDIGAELATIKKNVKEYKRSFEKFVDNNLPFCPRTASKYINVFKNKDIINNYISNKPNTLITLNNLNNARKEIGGNTYNYETADDFAKQNCSEFGIFVVKRVNKLIAELNRSSNTVFGLDHCTSLRNGGIHDMRNRQVLTNSANIRKGADNWVRMSWIEQKKYILENIGNCNIDIIIVILDDIENIYFK